MGVIIWGLFHPVSQVIPQSLHNYPSVFGQAHPHALAVSSGFIVDYGCLSSLMDGRKPPIYSWGVPHLVCGSIPHQQGRCTLISAPDKEGYLPGSLPPLFDLASHDWVWWVAMFILGFTIHWYQWALMSFHPLDAHVPSNVYCHLTLPKVFTHFQWMLWQTSTVEAITFS